MPLTDRIRVDLENATNANNRTAVAILSRLVEIITAQEKTFRTPRSLTDAEVLTLVHEIKQDQHTALHARIGHGGERAQFEQECHVLDVYLPTPMSSQELQTYLRAKCANGGSPAQALADLQQDFPGLYDDATAAAIAATLSSSAA